MVDALAYTHLHYQAWCTRTVERVSQCGLQYGGSIVHPYEICAKVLSKWHQPLGILNIDPHLRCLTQIEIARVNVNDHVGSLDVLDDGMGSLLGHGSLRVTRKDAVHVEVEVGYAPLNGVYAKRIECRIDFQCTSEQFRMFAHDTR